MNFRTVSCLAVALLHVGCASIVHGQNQSVSVETRHADQSVVGANCTLLNDKGTWLLTTPGSAVVHRSYADLVVKCEKAPLDPGLLTAKSFTKGMAFGNIIFGGFIGAGVDIATGAAYDYPVLMTVVMGQATEMKSPVAVTPNVLPAPTTVSAQPPEMSTVVGPPRPMRRPQAGAGDCILIPGRTDTCQEVPIEPAPRPVPPGPGSSK